MKWGKVSKSVVFANFSAPNKPSFSSMYISFPESFLRIAQMYPQRAAVFIKFGILFCLQHSVIDTVQSTQSSETNCEWCLKIALEWICYCCFHIVFFKQMHFYLLHPNSQNLISLLFTHFTYHSVWYLWLLMYNCIS